MLEIVPVSFATAAAFVDEHHRHHKPPKGMKFSIGVARDGVLVGVAMVGRPVTRLWDDGFTLEVNRTCVLDDEPNANSMLYGAAWRAAKALGYRRCITYTQEGESGASLRAAGWVLTGARSARKAWDSPSRPRENHGNWFVPRLVWEIRREGTLTITEQQMYARPQSLR